MRTLHERHPVRLAEISIKRPVFAWMLMAALILFGAVGFNGMGISQLPDVDFPVVNIGLSYPGAAPEVMESTVVDPIEDAVMGIQGVKRITSSSLTGAANVTVEFDLSRDIEAALNDVNSKLDQARINLPVDLEPPITTKTNPEDQPIIWLALTSERMPMNEMSKFVKDRLKGEFATLPGVGDIRLGGYVDPALRVWVKPEALRKYELSISDIVNTIRSEHYEPPSGYLAWGPKEFNVRTMGEGESPKDFQHMYITARGGTVNFKPIPLTDTAVIQDGLEDVRRLARSNGQPAIGLGIQKQRGANAVAVAREVRARLAQVQKTLPQGMKLEIRNDSSRFVEEAVQELNFTLVLSAILTACVCWLFLGSWSATLNVLLAIPTSVVGAFAMLYFLGFTLNTFTLLALSLSIGIVVDDAIMVLENIVRHREHGQSRLESALFGTREITFAAVAATFSILAIFLPVAFMKGIIGRFFFQFGLTMTVAVLLSLLEALTLTPMRCSQFVDIGERRTRLGHWVEAAFDGLRAFYTRLLEVALRRRLLVLLGACAVFAASLLALKGINREFLPAEDQSQFLIRVKTPIGSSLEFTSERFEKIEKFLLSRPEVDGVFSAIGGFQGGQVNTGFAFVGLKPKDQRELSQAELMRITRQQLNEIPGVQATVQDLSARGFSTSRGFPVEFTIEGPAWDELIRQSDRITGELKKTGLVTDVDTDYEGTAPEIDIIPNRREAEARGVSIAQIGEVINAAIGGLRVARYTSDGRRYDVWVKLAESPEWENMPPLERISRLFVRNNRGELVQLPDVVKIVERKAPINLTRLNRQRAITVFANVAPGRSQQDALNKAVEIGRSLLPAGYRLEISGTAQTFQESAQSLVFALLLGILVAYMILATQFNSFSDPVTVLTALPFSLSGAFFALLLTGQSLNLYSMIGLILLMGIVKKNSILLIDFTNQVRDREGASIHEGLIRACPVRLRPIVMTSIAQIAGALPPAIAFGPGAESRRPMAISVIGGVLLSTLLTLFVVPCVYTYLARGRRALPAVDRILAREERKRLEAA